MYAWCVAALGHHHHHYVSRSKPIVRMSEVVDEIVEMAAVVLPIVSQDDVSTYT